MNEAETSTTTLQSGTPKVAERWTSAIHAAAADLDAAAAEHIGISIEGLRITANEWSATLSVVPRLEARVYPGGAHENVKYDTTLGLEQLSALYAVLGGILRRTDAAAVS